jgi:hypothetical protein
MIEDVIKMLGYKAGDDSWHLEGRRTYLHDDNATRAYLTTLRGILGRHGWHRDQHALRTFRHELTGQVIEIEPAGSKGMGSHQSAAMLKDEWLTPPEIIHALGGPGSFDLDPCSPINRPWATAKRHYTIVDNGLLHAWSGRVWLNPPYGGPPIVRPWMQRMSDHREGIALIFARTETEVFFKTVWRAATAILFLEGRLYFHHVYGTRAKANAGAPSVLIAYGDDDARILKNCGIDGQFIELGSAPARSSGARDV